MSTQVLAWVLLASVGHLDAKLSGHVGVEYDSNARRAVPPLPGEPSGFRGRPVEVIADPVTRASVSFDTAWTPDDGAHALHLDLDLGAKRFFAESEQDLVAAEVGLGSRHAFGPLHLGLAGRHRSSRMRGGFRDHDTDVLSVDALWRLHPHWQTELSGSLSRFGFLPEPRFDHWGPGFEARLAWLPAPAWRWHLGAGHVWRNYAGHALVIGTTEAGTQRLTFCDGEDPDLTCQSAPRHDRELRLGTQASFNGPWVARVGYLARLQTSSSPFEDVNRHRFSASITVELPLHIVATARGALQLSDRSSPTRGRLLTEDDENQNLVQVQLLYPIASQLDLEVRYGYFASVFSTAGTGFERQTAYIGLSARTSGVE